MPAPKIYKATELASEAAPRVVPLDGTLKGAQRYVDKITRSPWWKSHCPPSWMNSEWDDQGRETLIAPNRIWVVEDNDPDSGGSAHVSFLVYKEGHRIPQIELGHDKLYCGVEAIADPWVILHEVAHVMSIGMRDNNWHDAWHDPYFVKAFRMLVGRWLGKPYLEALEKCCKEARIRLI